MGFRYLWWYSLFPVWAQGFKLAVVRLKHLLTVWTCLSLRFSRTSEKSDSIYTNLVCQFAKNILAWLSLIYLIRPANTNDIRRQAYELIYLLTNTETWKDMYDDVNTSYKLAKTSCWWQVLIPIAHQKNDCWRNGCILQASSLRLERTYHLIDQLYL